MAFLTPDPRHLGRSDAARRRPRPRRSRRRAKYRRWDGSQDLPDLTADEIVDALADDVLEHGDLGEALRRLMERGLRGSDPSRGDLHGLRDLLDRLRDRREDILRQGRADGPAGRRPPASWTRSSRPSAPASSAGWTPRPIRERPAATGQRPPDPRPRARCCAASRPSGSTALDALPPDVGARIRALQDYDFIDGDARQRFEELRRPPPRHRCSTG